MKIAFKLFLLMCVIGFTAFGAATYQPATTQPKRQYSWAETACIMSEWDETDWQRYKSLRNMSRQELFNLRATVAAEIVLNKRQCH